MSYGNKGVGGVGVHVGREGKVELIGGGAGGPVGGQEGRGVVIA